MPKLAIKGGKPVRSTPLPSQNTIGEREEKAVMRVMKSGELTGYKADWSAAFYGGREVRGLEEEWGNAFGTKYAIAVNSATSGLDIACGAIRDSVNSYNNAGVTPFSMSCSATAPLGWHADRVVFGDIEEDFYCLKPSTVGKEREINYAIAVSLFGQPYDANGFYKSGVPVIEDAAQAVGAQYSDGRYAGTLGDIGVYSLNLGKHLTSGEGGIIVTDDSDLAHKCRLLMNHAEAVINSQFDQGHAAEFPRLWGRNLRMTEMQAAVARVQLERLDELLQKRLRNVNFLLEALRGVPCIDLPKVREGCTHTYYVVPLRYTWMYASPTIHRDRFVGAVQAELQPVQGRESEGVPISCGYIKPIQSMPLFGMPASLTPTCARIWRDELIALHRLFGPGADMQSLRDVADAFTKVWENKEELYDQ